MVYTSKGAPETIHRMGQLNRAALRTVAARKVFGVTCQLLGDLDGGATGFLLTGFGFRRPQLCGLHPSSWPLESRGEVCLKRGLEDEEDGSTAYGGHPHSVAVAHARMYDVQRAKSVPASAVDSLGTNNVQLVFNSISLGRPNAMGVLTWC
jgi:hypothetical protein